jgi:hypothetical protein
MLHFYVSSRLLLLCLLTLVKCEKWWLGGSSTKPRTDLLFFWHACVQKPEDVVLVRVGYSWLVLMVSILACVLVPFSHGPRQGVEIWNQARICCSSRSHHSCHINVARLSFCSVFRIFPAFRNVLMYRSVQYIRYVGSAPEKVTAITSVFVWLFIYSSSEILFVHLHQYPR